MPTLTIVLDAENRPNAIWKKESPRAGVFRFLMTKTIMNRLLREKSVSAEAASPPGSLQPNQGR